jgi:hypothetical protein
MHMVAPVTHVPTFSLADLETVMGLQAMAVRQTWTQTLPTAGHVTPQYTTLTMQHQLACMAIMPWAPATQGRLVMFLSPAAMMVPLPQYLTAQVLSVAWNELVHVMCHLLHMQVCRL